MDRKVQRESSEFDQQNSEVIDQETIWYKHEITGHHSSWPKIQNLV